MKKIILKWMLALAAVFVMCTISAQTPTITGFTPASGPTGTEGSTTVIINGTGFSPTSSADIVSFGGVTATVTAATPTQLTVSAPSGATWQPLSVTLPAFGLTAYSYAVPNPFIPTFGTAHTITANSFASKVDFAAGTNTYAIASGDLDGDGKPDLAVLNNGSATVSVFRNTSTTGAITASSFAAKVDFATGTSPQIIAISDLDGDGKPDLVMTNYGSNTVSVFRNISTVGAITTGSFAAKVDFATGTNPQGLAIGDLDGDGKPDLVVTNYGSNTVSVLRNISTVGAINAGSFAAKVNFTTGTLPYFVVIGDLDGDGKPDMAVANNSSNTVSVFRNTSNVGSITTSSFATKVDFATGSYPSGVAIGDLDGDGKPDLAVTNYTSSTVSVFRNTSTVGAITLATKVDFVTGTSPQVIAISDLDGDGKADMAVINLSTNSLSVFRNISTGTINTGSFATKVDFATGSAPYGLAIGDLDGDGKPDLAVANYTSSTVSIFKNGQFTVTGFTPASGPTGAEGSTTVLINGTGFSATASNDIVSFGGVKATVTTATSTQLTVSAPWGSTWQPLSVTLPAFGLTAYSYAAANPFIPTFGTTHTITANSFSAKVDFVTGTAPWGVAIGDLDGDGKPDLAVTNSGSATVSVFRNNSTTGAITIGSFAAKVDFAAGTNPRGIAIGDLDGDGKPELVVTNNGSATVSVFRNISTVGTINASSFATKVDFSTGTNPQSVAIGDLDGDGKPDMAVTNNGSATVSILRNISSVGSITTGSFAAKVDFATGTNPYALAIGDLDGDGKPDMAVTNNGSSTVSIFRNTPTVGSITASSFAAKVDFTTGTAPFEVAIGDLDGDGKADLVVANLSSSTVSIFKNVSTVGTITFATKVDFTAGSSPRSVTIGDMDGDGKPDLVMSNFTSATVSIFRNITTVGTINASSFATKVDFATGTSPYFVAIGDLDGDGRPDLAVTNNGSATISVFKNGKLTVTGFTPANGPTGAEGSTTVLVSGTGFSITPSADIVSFGGVKATVTAAASTQLTVSAPWGSTWQPLSVTVPTLGLTAYSYALANPFIPTFGTIHTITVSSFAAKVDFITGTSPSVVAIGDLDGDGKPDLAVSNYGSATVSIFHNTSTTGAITGGSFDAKVDFTTGTNPYGVAIGDLDGDGKLDLAVSNFGSSTVSVFLNISTVGTITTGSFATKVDFATGANPECVAIGDLDVDGKPDLVVANAGSATISVLRNISTTGSINAGSFAAKVDFATGTNPWGIAIGDLDGDGVPDLAVTNGSSATVSVFRSKVVVGAINAGSFAAKVDFTTGTTPQGIAIGDLDGDGKADLVVSNFGSNTVSIFQNTSTTGSITTASFATKVDFTTGSSPNGVAIGDLDGDGKADLAVSNFGSATVSVFRNISTTGSITTGSFVTKVDFSTGTMPFAVVIGDLNGDGKADLTVSNYGLNTISVLKELTKRMLFFSIPL